MEVRDLNSLVGKVYLYIKSSKGEVAVNSIEMYTDKKFRFFDTAEQRLEVLFKLKDKWLLCELEALLGEFLEPEVKMLVMLGKSTRVVKE